MGLACGKKSFDQVRPSDDKSSGKTAAASLEKALLMKLSNDLAGETDTGRVMQMVVTTTCAVLSCEYACLFLREHGDIASLVYCEVAVENKTLQTTPLPSSQQGLVGRVWTTGNAVSIPSVAEATIGANLKSAALGPLKLPHNATSVACVPWKDAIGKVLGVLLVCNRREGLELEQTTTAPFDSDDVAMLTTLLSVAVRQRTTYDFIKRVETTVAPSLKDERPFSPRSFQLSKFDSLMSILSASLAASKNKDLKKLIGTILLSSQSLLACDRCALFAVDSLQNELVGFEFSGGGEELEETQMSINGLVGEVATSGRTVNIVDAGSDKRFSRERDEETVARCGIGGVSRDRTKSMLLIPLATAKGRIIAVLRAVNKFEAAFDDGDEKALTIVGDLVCDVLQRILLDRSLCALFAEDNDVEKDLKDMLGSYVLGTDAQDEVLQSDSKAELCMASSNSLSRSKSRYGTNGSSGLKTPASLEPMQKWEFDHWKMNSTWHFSSIALVLDHLGLFEEFSIPKDALEPYLRSFKGGYSKKTPYHNWAHAFDTFHKVFAMMTTDILSPGTLPIVDEFALLLAALGHDMHHPGMNNQFLVNRRDELALRYNDNSVLENHHASATCTLLEKFTKEFIGVFATRFRKVLVASILDTDMARHHEQLAWMDTTEIDTFAASASEEPLEPESALKLGGVILHCADLSHPTLPWVLHHRMSLCIAQEFYAQFQEESRLGLPSLPFMGKDPNDMVGLAPTQVGFIRFVAVPLWTALGRLIPGTDILEKVIKAVAENQDSWQMIADGELTVDAVDLRPSVLSTASDASLSGLPMPTVLPWGVAASID